MIASRSFISRVGKAGDHDRAGNINPGIVAHEQVEAVRTPGRVSVYFLTAVWLATDSVARRISSSSPR